MAPHTTPIPRDTAQGQRVKTPKTTEFPRESEGYDERRRRGRGPIGTELRRPSAYERGHSTTPSDEDPIYLDSEQRSRASRRRRPSSDSPEGFSTLPGIVRGSRRDRRSPSPKRSRFREDSPSLEDSSSSGGRHQSESRGRSGYEPRAEDRTSRNTRRAPGDESSLLRPAPRSSSREAEHSRSRDNSIVRKSSTLNASSDRSRSRGRR